MAGARTLTRRLASACVAGLCLVLPASAPAATAQLPDLVADPPLFPELQNYSDESGTRLLLRFDGFVHNKGAGAVEVRGSARVGSEMTAVAQRIFNSDGTWTDATAPRATLRYENGDGHRHWHLGQAARYSLWNATKTAEVAPAQKVGFCFKDSEQRELNVPDEPVYSNAGQGSCDQDKPTVSSVYMGISAGWRDIYQRVLAFQWVDVSDVAPGTYWLRTDVDPNDAIQESNETNAPAYMSSSTTIPGYIAQPLVRQGIEQGEPATLTLSAAKFGTPGAAQYRIVTAPEHGKLSVAAGSWFAGPTLTYTPDPGYSGSDSFSYAARDSASPFPRNPSTATVALGVQRTKAEAVAISGAPAQLYTGTSAQLTATVANGPPQVTWSVGGVPGGNATVGTISAAGLYSAPAAPPPGGKVIVRADGSYGGFAEVELAVVKAPEPEPAPEPGPTTPPPPGTGTPPGGGHTHDPETPPHEHPQPQPPPPPPVLPPPLLSQPQVSANGRRLFVKTVPGRDGVVETKAEVRGRRIALCRSQVPAGRSAVCKLWVPRRYRAGTVTLVVKLRVGRSALATRRATAPLPR